MAVVISSARDINAAKTAESQWRQWLAKMSPRYVTLEELLRPSQRMVVVSPHPDDEVLACGGLISLHANRGADISIVAVTDGEASHRGDPTWSGVQLAATRSEERERGLAHLGLGPGAVTRLSLPDSGVALYADALARALGDLLRPTDCVVTTWRLDGHPDHDATGVACAEVCDQMGCCLLEAAVWMWDWSGPADPRVAWHRLYTLPLPRATLMRKAAALAQHRTQMSPRAHDAPVLGPAIRARAAWQAEYFFIGCHH